MYIAEHLKIEIHNLLGIPPHRQILDGWKSTPECEQTILGFCSQVNDINYLTVQEIVNTYDKPLTPEYSQESTSEINPGKELLQ